MIYKKGNLFDSKCRVIAHGVNCQGAFGSGVAGQIAKLYPYAKTCYLAKHHGARWNLGDVQFVGVNDDRIIANCATQFNYGRSGIYVDYDAVAKCFNQVFSYAKNLEFDVAIPWIGCGLAGGDKEEVRRILQQCYQGRNLHLEIWEL